MTKTLMALTAAAAMFCVQARAVEPDSTTNGRDPDAKSIEIPFDQMTFRHTGAGSQNPTKPGVIGPDIMVFDTYGKFGGGRHGTVMKFPAGMHTRLHTHTGDYYAVLISGTMKNYRPGGTPVVMSEPGSFWFQKGGEPHVTECISDTDCYAFLVQSVKFDAQFLDEWK